MMSSILTKVLTEKWFWTVVILLTLIFVMPFVVILALVYLPFPLNTIVIIVILVCWGVAAGYKDWMTSKSKEEAEAKKET